MPQRAIADPAFPTHRRRDLCGRGFPSGLAFFPAGASREGQGQGRAGNSQAGSSSQDGLPRGQGSAGGRLSPARRTACRRSRCVGRSPGPSRDGGRPPRCRRARAVPLSEGEEAIRRAALLLFLSVLLLPGLDGPSDYGCLWRKGDHGHPSQGGIPERAEQQEAALRELLLELRGFGAHDGKPMPARVVRISDGAILSAVVQASGRPRARFHVQPGLLQDVLEREKRAGEGLGRRAARAIRGPALRVSSRAWPETARPPGPPPLRPSSGLRPRNGSRPVAGARPPRPLQCG
jgi:hypothetical protein